MGRARPQQRRRACAVNHQTLFAGNTPTQVTSQADVAFTFCPLRLLAGSSSPLPQDVCGLSRANSLSIGWESHTFAHQPERLQRQQMPFEPELQVPEQEQQRIRILYSTVAYHTRSAGGRYTFPGGGAAGATEAGVVSLFRDGYNSSTRYRARSSLPAYHTISQGIRGGGSTEIYRRASGPRDDDAEETRSVRRRSASNSSSRPLSPALLSRAARNESLNRFYPSFNQADQRGRGPRRREPSFPAARTAEGPSSAAGGTTAGEQPLGAEAQPRRQRPGATKNLRVSFAADLPLRHSESATLSEKVCFNGGRAAGVAAQSSATSEEERQFLLYGFGRTRAGGFRSESGQSSSAVVAPGRAATAAGRPTRSSALGWKLSWPSALRRKRSKEIVTEVRPAVDNDQLLLSSHLPSLSAIEAGRSKATSEPRRERAVTPSSKALLEAAASEGNSSTQILQKAESDEVAAPVNTAVEARANSGLGGLHRFRQRLSLGREHALIPLQQHRQQLRTVDRPSLVQPFVPASSQLRGGELGSTWCGYSDDSRRGHPFSAPGIGSSLLVESGALPAVSVYASQGIAAAKEELVFAAEGGGTAAVAAHTGGRSFWWRAEARASRTFGCSKGFARGWHLPTREGEDSLLPQPSEGQQVQRQACEPQQPDLQQERQLSQQQQVLQLQQQQAIARQRLQKPHQVAAQIPLSKCGRLCLQRREGPETASEWQPEQLLWKQAGGNGPSGGAETLSGKHQTFHQTFSFSVHHEKQTYFATQQEAVYGSACEQSYPATRQAVQKLQQQVSDLPLQQELPVQKQQSRQEQSRLKREQRLQQKLTVHRRVPSIKNTSANDCASSWANLPQVGTRVGFAAFCSKEEDHKLIFSSPLLTAEAEKTTAWQQTRWRGNSSDSDPTSLNSISHYASAEARPRVRICADSAVPAAATQVSFAGSSRDTSVYAAARRSPVAVGFTGAATSPTHKQFHASSGDSVTLLEDETHAGRPSISLYNSTSLLQEQGRHSFGSSLAAPPTTLSPVTTVTTNTSLSTFHSAAVGGGLPVANPFRSRLGRGATAAQPATAALHPLSLEAPGAPTSAAGGVKPLGVLSPDSVAASGKQRAGAAREQQGEASTARTASMSGVRATPVKEVLAGNAANSRATLEPEANTTGDAADGTLTCKPVTVYSRARAAALAASLPISQELHQQQFDHGAQRHKWNAEHLKQLEQRDSLQMSLPQGKNTAVQQLQKSGKGQQEQGRKGQENIYLETFSAFENPGCVVDGQDLQSLQSTEKIRGSFTARSLRQTNTTSAALAAGDVAAAGTEGTTPAATAAAPPTVAGARRKQISAARQREAEFENVAVEKQLTTEHVAGIVEETSDTREITNFVHKGTHSNTYTSVSRKASQGPDVKSIDARDVSKGPRPGRYSLTDGRKSSRRASAGSSLSSTRAPHQRQAKSGTSLQVTPLARVVSGCCRAPGVRLTVEDEEQRQQCFRRGSNSSTSSSSSSSSRRSTNSSSSDKYQCRSSAGDEPEHKHMRFVSLPSLTTVVCRHPSSQINKADGTLAAGSEVATAAAASPTAPPTVHSQDAGDVKEGGDGKLAARLTTEIPGKTAGVEENGCASELLKRGQSRLHAVFSSLALAVRKGSHSISLKAGTRKPNLKKTVTPERATEVAATASSSIIAAAGNEQVLITREVTSLHTTEEKDASAGPMQASTVNFATGEVSPRTGPVAAYADDDEAYDSATGGSQASNRRSQGGTIDDGHLGRRSTTQEGQAGAEAKVPESGEVESRETDNGTRVLKCYSLPKEEDARGHRENFPEGAPSVMSLDSQSSSVLSCRSFSSSSSSDSHIETSSATAARARGVVRQQSRGDCHSGEREEPERAAEEDREDDEEFEEEEAEDEKRFIRRKRSEKRLSASRGEDEDTGSEEAEEEVSLFTAGGDPRDPAGGEQTTAAAKDQYDATATAAGETVAAVEYVYGYEEKERRQADFPGEAEEEVEIEVKRDRRTRLQTERQADASEAKAASYAAANERVAQRAAAKRIAAARAVVELAEAQRTAAERATQAEAAAVRAAAGREDLIQAAAAASEHAPGSEPAEGDVRSPEKEVVGPYKVPRARKQSSAESIRRRSTASSAGSTEPVIVEARGNRLVRGKSVIAAVAAPPAHTTAMTGEPKRNASLGLGETVARHGDPKATIGETRTVQPVPAAAEQRRLSSEAPRSAFQALAPELEGPAVIGTVIEEERLRVAAAKAGAAARAEQKASAAAARADDASAAAAAVAEVKAREALRAEEEADAAADAMQETASAAYERSTPKDVAGSSSSAEEFEADVSELKRYAAEFLLEEANEEPASTAGKDIAPDSVHGTGRGRENLRRVSTGATRRHSAAVRSGTRVEHQHHYQNGSHARSQSLQRRRSQVLSREEELAAIAGEIPHLIEEDEDGAVVLARRAEAEIRSRRGVSRFAVSQTTHGGSANIASASDVQTAGAATSHGVAAAAAKSTATVPPDMVASLAADAADAEVAAAAAGQAGVEAVSRGLQRKSYSAEERRASRRGHSLRLVVRKQGTNLAENGEGGIDKRRGSERRKKGQERNGDAAGFDERGDTVLEARLPLEQPYGSDGAPPSYQHQLWLVHDEQHRVHHTSPSAHKMDEEVAAVRGGGGGIRRTHTSAVQAPPRRAWSTLAQVREGSRQFREEGKIAGRRKDEEEEGDRADHHKDNLQRRSLQEKHLVKRLLRHRTLQSPLLTVPPPFDLQKSPVLQAVYSKGDGGAAGAVVRAASGHRDRQESRD